MNVKTFKAATWNVFHGTSPDELRPLVRARLREGVTLFLFQELQRKDVRAMLRDEGLRLFVASPQYAIAFVPGVWRLRSARRVDLAKTKYFRPGGTKPIPVQAILGLLTHKPSGEDITALSYHTPSHVQVRDQPANRVQALREAMATLGRLGAEASTDAVLFGGDDNVDERLSSGPWDFMLKVATGLRQVQAPEATHGRVRKIDDFRVRRLHVGQGWVREGGGDHDAHVREFTFR